MGEDFALGEVLVNWWMEQQQPSLIFLLMENLKKRLYGLTETLKQVL